MPEKRNNIKIIINTKNWLYVLSIDNPKISYVSAKLITQNVIAQILNIVNVSIIALIHEW